MKGPTPSSTHNHTGNIADKAQYINFIVHCASPAISAVAGYKLVNPWLYKV